MDNISIPQVIALGLMTAAFTIETVSLLLKDEMSRSVGRLAGGIWRLIAAAELFVLTHCWHAMPLTYFVPGNVIVDANMITGLFLLTGLVTVGSGINKLRNCLKSKC